MQQSESLTLLVGQLQGQVEGIHHAVESLSNTVSGFDEKLDNLHSEFVLHNNGRQGLNGSKASLYLICGSSVGTASVVVGILKLIEALT